VETILTRLATEQDYVLFLGILCWIGVATIWAREARRDARWDWLPWTAGAGIIAGALELYAFNNPVVPIRDVPPFLWIDRLHGILLAVMLVGWYLPGGSGWKGTGRTLRIIAAVGLVGAAGARWIDPDPALGSWALAVAATAALVARPGIARAWAVVAVWGSWIGPASEALTEGRRWTEAAGWSLLCGVIQLTAGLIALIGLLREWRQQSVPDSERALWRPWWIAGTVWLVVGLLLSGWVGSRSRQTFESSMVSRVATAAAFMDREVLSEALGAEFKITGVYQRPRPGGKVTNHAFAEHLVGPAGLALRRALGKIERVNPDPKFLYVSTIRDGWIVDITSDQQRRRSPAGVGLSSRVTPRLQEVWDLKTAAYFAPYPSDRGLLTAARAPLFDPQGRMLGWLTFEFSTAAWSASQSQARLLVFVIVAFGLGLAVLVALQRQRFRERELARASANISAMADQMKTVFLAKVSHELRTPIQSILGYGELLAGKQRDQKSEGHLGALRQHGQLMLRLVNDLLDLTSIQTGAFRLHERPTSFAEVVGQTVESLRPRADAKRLQISWRIDPAVPKWARVDGERIRQITFNLVGNAIKFTDAGRVEVSLTSGSTPQEVCLRVFDTGPGIPEAERARLFHPFSRLEATANKEGTGLGLSLAAALCRSMRGEIALDSPLGGGACFSATFQAPPCDPIGAQEPALDGSLQGRRILIAEDNSLVRELFTVFLADRGAECVAVGDGTAAVEFAQRERFDAMVLDLNLPMLDGFEVVERLRPQLREGLKIVGVSAHAGDSVRERALAVGMHDFLIKPVSLSALAHTLNPQAPVIVDDRAEGLRTALTAQFRREAVGQRAAIMTALRNDDLPSLRAAAHYVMNSAAVVRDNRLFVASHALEQATAGDDRSAIRARWAECDEAFKPWLSQPLSTGDDPRSAKPTTKTAS